MRDKIYLVMGRRGVMSMKKRPPNLRGGEVGVCINVNVPDGVFRQPLQTLDMVIPEDSVSKPKITMEVVPA